MRKLRTALVAGIATLGLAGTALAATHELHVMNVDLPDGSVAKIEYAGKVAPTVEIAPAVTPVAVFDTGFPDPVIAADFAGLDRLEATMAAQQHAMMQQAAAMEQAAESGNLHWANGKAPANGSWSYTVMTSSNGKEACTRTVSWTSDGQGKQPQVQRTSAGDCDAVKRDTAPVPAAATKPVAQAPLQAPAA